MVVAGCGVDAFCMKTQTERCKSSGNQYLSFVVVAVCGVAAFCMKTQTERCKSFWQSVLIFRGSGCMCGSLILHVNIN